MLHVLSVMVENRAGALAKIAGLFSRRGYNIESLTVGETENPQISKMTILVKGDDQVIEQVTKQLHKLVEVIKISDITADEHVNRELVLIKVSAEPEQRAEVLQIADIFRAKVVDVGLKSLIIESTGTQDKISAIVSTLKPYGIKEIIRSGQMAMLRGAKNRND